MKTAGLASLLLLSLLLTGTESEQPGPPPSINQNATESEQPGPPPSINQNATVSKSAIATTVSDETIKSTEAAPRTIGSTPPQVSPESTRNDTRNKNRSEETGSTQEGGSPTGNVTGITTTKDTAVNVTATQTTPSADSPVTTSTSGTNGTSHKIKSGETAPTMEDSVSGVAQQSKHGVLEN
ncbi:mucin-13-like isoform X6 [Conger conger]|uniref:mucin-13-like isoform X6 n=1 Tax=Conger conger TaxID=82655 RepID=UPI002A5AE2B1|nr:mucin-13-like isoform X6 [Conger conger]